METQGFTLDIRTFVLTAGALSALFGLITLVRSLGLFRSRDSLKYSRLRQRQSARALRGILISMSVLFIAFLLFTYGESTIYRVFPITPTPSPTPSNTPSPTATLSPTITFTPTATATLQFTLTPSPTSIPILPQSIASQFESVVTPSPDTVFSPLTFSRTLDLDTYTVTGVGTVFENPVNQIYTTFSYDHMLPGVQWTALWYRQGELVYFETLPWNGGTGGYGFSEWAPKAEEWTPGDYQVQIFVGSDVVSVGNFTVEGDALTSTPTPTFTPTNTATPTITDTPTITPSLTRQPTDTTAP